MRNGAVVILGVFVADLAFRAERQPKMGETVLGSGFALGPGGKGSNQAVAAGRLGADVTFISQIGDDEFGRLGLSTWTEAGVTPHVTKVKEDFTGAAYIFIEESSGDNAIIISPGVAASISPEMIDASSHIIESASVFVTQLEQPIDAARRALEIARGAGVTTILNPAPAAPLDNSIFALCDYVTPNETETEALTGVKVVTPEDAKKAGDVFLEKGVKTALITLGEAGAVIHNNIISEHVPAFDAGVVVETTGAGDAFNGGFATGLAQGMAPVEAVRFGSATAAISVTRAGTAPSMPQLEEVKRLLAG